jgi:hypothetical protein
MPAANNSCSLEFSGLSSMKKNNFVRVDFGKHAFALLRMGEERREEKKKCAWRKRG